MSDTTPKPNRKHMSFYKALEEVFVGKKITRLEWATDNVYGILADDKLKIHRDDKLHDWIISAGDMSASDWVIIS